MNVRPRDGKKNNDPWYNPERDLLTIWPSTLLKSAAYAADRQSSINRWLIQQIPQDDIVKRIRAQLVRLVEMIKKSRSTKLEDILSADMVDWPVFQAIMFSAGIMLFKSYNKFYRGQRMTDAHGGVQDPVGNVDELGIMRAFDELVEKSKLIV
jgi:hypothetical protein